MSTHRFARTLREAFPRDYGCAIQRFDGPPHRRFLRPLIAAVILLCVSATVAAWGLK